MQAKVLEEASLLWAVVEIVGLTNVYTYFVSNEREEGVDTDEEDVETGEEGVETMVTRSKKNGVKTDSN